MAACIQINPNADPNQPPPAPVQPQMTPATYVIAAECTQRQGTNGGTGFWDIGLQQCWSCPGGSARTVFDVRGNTACQSGGIFGPMSSAEFLGTASCPTNTFSAQGGCFSCPQGMTLNTSTGSPMCG